MNLLPGGSAPTAFVNYKAKARSGIDLSGPAIVWLEGLSFFSLCHAGEPTHVG